MGKTISKIILYLALFLGVLNFLGVFTPEIGFDALWYHLTLPKLWLLTGEYHFSGGLLYYSVMPRLTEWLFTPLIYFTGTIGPKLLQYISGVLVSYLTYKIARRLDLSKSLSVLAGSLFYLSYLVSWQSSSAYIDLFRSLMEVTALYFFLKDKKYLGALFLGLSLGTKWLSLFSVVIYSFVFGWQVLPLSLFVALPWFLTAYFYTGNPVFPLFDSILQNGLQPLLQMIAKVVTAPYQLTFPFDDFISPIAGLLFCLSAISFVLHQDKKRQITIVALLGGLSTLVLDPPSARFLLPFYPAIIISALLIIDKLPQNLQTLTFFLFLFSSILVVLLRVNAFRKNIPYLLGQQDQNQYLSSFSHRLPDTFIDADNFIKDNLAGQKILIDKLHNLYYFPYPFAHTSWSGNPRDYNYLITKDQNPNQINGQLIHTNSLGIQVFKLHQ